MHSSAATLATLPLPPGEPPGAGRFRILRPHAEGGLGRVFVACDTELGREVALKEIKPDRSDDSASRARFTLEAEITGRLEHPGIVPVYGLGTYPDGRPFYAMRFVRGKSLKAAIEKFHDAVGVQERRSPQHDLELHRLLQRLIDVCQAVHYAHSRGVLHRDLKPENVMLGKYGETLVVDWGLAKPLGAPSASPAGSRDASLHSLSSFPEPPLVPSGSSSAPTQMGTIVGTPAFMSPEQAQGRLDLLGPASDVFSLGAILYEILVGQPPYCGNAGLREVQTADYPPPLSINRAVAPPLNAICLKALAAAPEDRYAAANDLAQDLERYLADAPTTAYREPLAARVSRWCRNHEKSMAAVVAALFVGLGGAMLVGAVVSVKNLQLNDAHQSLTLAHQAERMARLTSDVRRKELEQFRTRLAFANQHLHAFNDPKNQPVFGLVLIDDDDGSPIPAAGPNKSPHEPPLPGFASPLQKDEVIQAIVHLFEVWGKPEQAAKWSKVLDQERQAQPSARPSATLREALELDEDVRRSATNLAAPQTAP